MQAGFTPQGEASFLPTTLGFLQSLVPRSEKHQGKSLSFRRKDMTLN